MHHNSNILKRSMYVLPLLNWSLGMFYTIFNLLPRGRNPRIIKSKTSNAPLIGIGFMYETRLAFRFTEIKMVLINLWKTIYNMYSLLWIYHSLILLSKTESNGWYMLYVNTFVMIDMQYNSFIDPSIIQEIF